jgi:hypothetical protein
MTTTSELATVTLDFMGGDARRRRLEQATASLPVSIGFDIDDARVIWVDATVPDWSKPVELALGRRPQVIVVSDPRPLGAGVVARIADDARTAGVATIIDSRWASSVGVEDFASTFGSSVATAALLSLDVRYGLDDYALGDQFMLDAMHLLRSCGCAVELVKTIDDRAHGHSFFAHTATGALIHSSGVASPAWPGTARLRVFGMGEMIRLETIDSDGGAMPSTLSRTDAAGELFLPTTYEDPRRTTLRRGIAIANGDAPVVDELAALATDLRSLEQDD